MNDIPDTTLKGQELEACLKDIFQASVVTSDELASFLRITPVRFRKMRMQGNAPRMIPLTLGGGDGRFLVADVASWIEAAGVFGRCPSGYNPDGTPRRGRGRPKKAA